MRCDYMYNHVFLREKKKKDIEDITGKLKIFKFEIIIVTSMFSFI